LEKYWADALIRDINGFQNMLLFSVGKRHIQKANATMYVNGKSIILALFIFWQITEKSA
jgi:hypothetical protein